MTLRTPRRRISPQTRRRCRAIKGFFKRALGSLSQPDLLQITSSIAVNVTDINHKIVGLEQQLSEVCKTCRDSIREIHTARSKSPTPIESKKAICQREIASGTKLRREETNIIYVKPKTQYQDSVQSVSAFGSNNESNKVKSDNRMNNTGFHDEYLQKLRKKKSKVSNMENLFDLEPKYPKRKTESSHKNFLSSYSTSSFHSLDQFRKMNYSIPGYSGNLKDEINQNNVQSKHHGNKTHRKWNPEKYDEKPDKTTKRRKSKHRDRELDSDFIADIIKRQYKPLKFGRRNSDLSQFSAPVCRDPEFVVQADCYNIPEEKNTCNCGGQHYSRFSRHSDFSDVKSVCDARVYNARQNHRTKHHRRQTYAYDNSDIYDLVPVKEKSSPKSRRKFFEDNMRSVYREVPPSPRTQRPQLNLKARYAESDYNVEISRNSGKKYSPKHVMQFCQVEGKYHRPVSRSRKAARRQSNEVLEENYDTTDIKTTKRRTNKLNQAEKQCTNSVISGIYPELAAEDPTVPVESPLNKTQETLESDKTDKALCEIKDILQSFLLEIKKETSSHNQKSSASAKMTESGNSALNNANTMTSNRQSFSNFNSGHCPVAPSPYMPTLPTFGNTCCYPIMPICPINCMQNGYAMPSGSFTQNTCVDKSNETCNTKIEANASSETDELIKEIYKFVSQSPTFYRKNSGLRRDSESKQMFRTGNKTLTSRSVGGSSRVCRHDAKVGTPRKNCVSKSCEAIKMTSDVYSSDTNTSYSDTVLNKLSQEATQSYSETESSTEISEGNKAKESKFYKVLKSLGLSKKIKKDVIEELDESETTVEEVKQKSPYHQNVVNYAVHGQEYHRPPPVSPNYRPEYPHDCHLHYKPNGLPWDPRLQTSRSHGSAHPHYRPEAYPSAPPHSQSYEGYQQMQPQVPLCLKEVEVKSIGCQSDKKLSFFRKVTQKIQPPGSSSQDDNIIRNGSTQTPQMNVATNNPGLFNWKNTHSKYMDNQINPQAFGYHTQKKLAQGDIKMRNAMLKKMFYKRNPFSPKNLIIRTLMGKDKSSFGDPPAAFRPRMFM